LASNGSLGVSWSAPASNGAVITNYDVSVVHGTDTPFTCSVSGTASSCDVTGLVNGTTYGVSVTATNSAGTSTPSTAVNATPATTPGAPTSIGIAPSNGTLSVTWNAPSDGGSEITGYTVTVDNGIDTPSTCTTGGTTTTCEITGLTNGSAYSVSVSATNGVGTTSSAGSVTATPATTPEAPTSLNVTVGNTSLIVTWAAPNFNGGASISSYTVTADNGVDTPTVCTVTDGSNACTLTGLTNGSDYSVTVTATNAQGEGAATDAVTATPAGSPTAPSNVTATAGNEQITVSWSASDGNGSAITAYTASSSDGSSCDTTGALSCVITSLTNGTRYSITVVATNGFGDSAASSSVSATPATVPTAPRWLHGVAGNATATLLWNASTSNGGAHIDSYIVSDLHGHGCTTSGLTCTVTGLTNGTTYTFYVTAHNVIGSSANSNSNIVIPLTTPSAPTIAAWHPGNHQVILTITAPTSNGEKSYYYEYSVNGGVAWATAQNLTTSNSVTIGLLTNGTAYRVAVRAVSQAGHSASSNVVTATPSTVASAPVITSVTLSANSTVIRIAALSTGGSAITAIQYSITGGSTWTSVSASANTRSISIAALPLKRTVNIALRAVNANGPSASSVLYAARRLK
jgi:fibronectin type 3 domain-containing protein